jgi:hypothetical protein
MHIPFQDDAAISVALKIVSDFNPDLMTCGSDGLDFYGISSFDKNPERGKLNMQEEIDAWKAYQHSWKDAAPNARRRFLVGNHEDRLRRYLWRHPELADLDALKLPNVLGLESLGIEWEWKKNELDACQEIVIEDNLVIKHGQVIRKYAGYTARAELESERYGISTLTGHSHRGGSTYAAIRGGMVQAHEGFCLCRLDPEYVRRPDWQQGIVLAEVTRDTVSVETVPIMTIRCRKIAFWRGKEYTQD